MDLLCLNTGLFIFSKHCKFDGKIHRKYVHSSSTEDQVIQETVRQTDKIRRTFPKFGGFVRQTSSFREDWLVSVHVGNKDRFFHDEAQI